MRTVHLKHPTSAGRLLEKFDDLNKIRILDGCGIKLPSRSHFSLGAQMGKPPACTQFDVWLCEGGTKPECTLPLKK